jgi:predicted RNase H-like HicB family nuclease
MTEIPKNLFKDWLLHLDVLIEKVVHEVNPPYPPFENGEAERSEQEDVFIAHCLQFDIITEGNTIVEAEEMIADAIFEYITFAMENNLTKFLFKPASPEYWQKLLYGHYKKRLNLDIYSRRLSDDADMVPSKISVV